MSVARKFHEHEKEDDDLLNQVETLDVYRICRPKFRPNCQLPPDKRTICTKSTAIRSAELPANMNCCQVCLLVDL